MNRQLVKKIVAIALLPLPVGIVVAAYHLYKYLDGKLRRPDIVPAAVAAPLTPGSRSDRDTQRITYISDAELVRRDPERVYPRTLTGIRVDVSKLQQIVGAVRW